VATLSGNIRRSWSIEIRIQDTTGNMKSLFINIAGLSGVLIAGAIGWMASSIRSSRYVSSIRMEHRATISTLSETVQRKTEQNEALESVLKTAEQQIRTLNERVLDISQQRSAALARLDYMQQIEKTLNESRHDNSNLLTTITELKQRQTGLETEIRKERQAAEEKIAFLEQMRTQMEHTFKALSSAVLKENNQSFLDLAHTTLSKYIDSAQQDMTHRSKAIESVIDPVKEALIRYDQHIQTMELAREKAYGGLSQQVVSMIRTQDALQKETGKLVKALRLPHVRGRWGEMTLQRVAELAGMHHLCDFSLQHSSDTDEGKIRPDMIVNLPGKRQIVIDAKAPLSAYLDSLEAETDQQRDQLLASHARQLQTHIHQLSRKAYWAQFDSMPEFVVLFLPGENFFSAALEQNPQLIEEGIEKNIILATPTTLISLLKTISFGWQQENMAENAKSICRLGQELYERLCSMAEHINRLGREIDRCCQTYNRLIGSFESRVLTSARKFGDFGIKSGAEAQLSAINPVEVKTRSLRSAPSAQLISLTPFEDSQPDIHEKR